MRNVARIDSNCNLAITNTNSGFDNTLE
jgi:uncharacterized protein